jgi:hypothetical protein
VPVPEAGTAALPVATAVLAPLFDDDGLVGDVFAHPTTKTVPTTMATATNREGADIENSFQSNGWTNPAG